MTITLAQIVVWLVVGAIAGSLAGSVVTGKWEGLGRWTSLGIGLVGALIGGAIFRLFGIWPGLEACPWPRRSHQPEPVYATRNRSFRARRHR